MTEIETKSFDQVNSPNKTNDHNDADNISTNSFIMKKKGLNYDNFP